MLKASCRHLTLERLRRVLVAGALTSFVIILLAAAGAKAAVCPNEQLRTQLHSGQLPDCRAYELVTPAFKEGNIVSIDAVAASGAHLVGESKGAFAGTEHDNSGEAGRLGTAYAFVRSEFGWLTSPLAPPSEQFPASGMWDASTDLSASLWRLRAPSQPEGEGDLFRREASGHYTHFGPLQPPGAAPQFGGEANYLGASQDLSHVLFDTELPESRWPGDTTTGRFSLYEYAGVEEPEPKLVGVRNEQRLSSNREAQLISKCGTRLGGVGDLYNAISADGGNVFFTALQCEGTPPADELYVRLGQSHTAALSEPSLPAGQCTGTCASAEHKEGVFRGASQDGSKAFFTTEQPLLNGDRDSTNDLYEAEVSSSGLQRLIQVSAGGTGDPTPGLGADVLGVARISPDGSHVYFVAKGVLTSVANQQGDEAESGANNLYVFETAHAGTIFIAKLSTEDAKIWQLADNGRPAVTTRDGRYLLFVSQAAITREPEAMGASQIYEYDALTGVLKRVSLGQHSPVLVPRIVSPDYEGVDSPSSGNSFMTMSDDGAYVFFEGEDSLTAQATTGLSNIYEYHDGHVYLISDGHDISTEQGVRGAQLVGTDPSGSDVFFRTGDGLVAQDTDTQRDVYDARVDGGFPGPISPAGCSAEACQGALSAAPSLLTAGSMIQAGNGNTEPAAKPVIGRKKDKRRKKRKHKTPRVKVKRRGRGTSVGRRGGTRRSTVDGR